MKIAAGVTAQSVAGRSHVSSSGGKESVARKVLLIDLDDLGRDQLSNAMSSGGASNIAALIASGRSWNTFWAAPNCSLFRARALSGADAYRPENYVGRLVVPADNFDGPAGAWLPSGLPGQKVKIGKWHTSNSPTFPVHLITQGWDRFVGLLSGLLIGGTGYYNWKEYDADSAGVVITQQTQHNTSRVAYLTLSELAAGTELIHASFSAIHSPFELPPNDEPLGKVYQGTTDVRIRSDMLFHLDYWLGVVIQDAVAKGYVVIVACDNGSSDAGKNSYKETGNNTPLFACGTGVVPGVSDRLIAATDLWATVRRLRGDEVTLAPDSVDFCDDLVGWSSIATPRQFLTLDWYHAVGAPPSPTTPWSRMIRDARWKYVDQKMLPSGTSGNKIEALHDLDGDPSELVNLLDAPLSSEASIAHALLLANLPQ